MRELLAIVLGREGYEVVVGGERAAGPRRARAPAGRSADLRHPHARHDRARRAARGEGDEPGSRRHHGHGVRLDRDGDRSAPDGRLRLHPQAVQRRRAEDRRRRRARAAAAAARERAAQARPRRAPPVLEHHRPQRGDAGGVRADRDDRPDHQHRAGDGGVGHRQGAGRPRHPLQLAAQGSPVRRGQLRRADRDAARVRAVRPRPRRVHRRRDQQEGPDRGRRAGHDLPRRDRRDEPADAGQAAAGAAGARVPAGRRHRRDRGRHPHHHRDQPRPGADGGGEQVPRGSRTTAST